MENISKLNSRSYRRKHKRYIIKFILVILTLTVSFGAVYLIRYDAFEKKDTFKDKAIRDNLEVSIYETLSNNKIRIEIYNRAISLNGGSSANSCVYFLSEVLRRNGMKINDSICNTSQLISIMEKEGFKIERDYTKLRPGSICFTTDSKLDRNGIPTHTYVFMGWKEEGSYDYAYICDNQAKDYDGKIYHLRNMKNVENRGGLIKEPFSFFLSKEK